MKKVPSSERRLAAIMFTDIVGYTKLMGENEDKAFHLLARNKAIQKPLIKRYGGRWLKEIGDGTLSSFSSALDAVYCANQIMQAYMDDPVIKLRIGIHIGDVTFSDTDVLGDGVNIASRLEEFANPNEILISEVVYYNIRNVEGINAELITEAKLKNVNESMRVYRIGAEIEEHKVSEEIGSEQRPKSIGRKTSPLRLVIAGIVILTLIVYGFLGKNINGLPQLFSSTKNKTVAVIQFENLGGQEENAYSIGITEDILIQLTKIHELTVIQQPMDNSKGHSDKTYKEIGDELGVAHLLLGSVWKQGDQLKVTARLINAQSEQVEWSNSWNKTFEDIFAIQSEIAISIADALRIKISSEETESIEKIPTSDITAYDFYLKGREYYLRFNEQDNLNAMVLFTEALKIDPQFILAHAGLSDVYSQLAQRSHIKSFWLDSAFYHAMIVTRNEPTLSSGHKSLGLYYSIIGNTNKAIEEFKKAVDIDKNLEAVINLSRIYYRTGQLDKSLEVLHRAKSRNPLNENLLFNYGATYYRLNDLQNANIYLDQALTINPGHINSLLLKWIIAVLSDDSEAAREAAVRLGYIAADDFEEALSLLQAEITGKSGDKTASARELSELLNGRELDYIDIPYLYVLIGQVYYEGGQQERANELFSFKVKYNLERIGQGESAYKFFYEIAQIYSITGQKVPALDYLENAVERGWTEYLFGLVDPAFRNLKEDPKFQDLVEKSRSNLNAIQNSVLRMENQRIG